MKKMIYFLSMLLVLATMTKAQESKSTIGFSVGDALKHENSIYIDMGNNSTWPDHSNNLFFNLFYDYQLFPSFKIGAHFEYEKAKFEDFYLGKSYANRYVLGIHWIGQYPKTPLHGELGGYFNAGVVVQEDFDHNPNGIEYGIIVGPALDLNKISLALHFQPGMSYFFSDKLPKAVMVFYPRVLVKIGYRF